MREALQQDGRKVGGPEACGQPWGDQLPASSEVLMDRGFRRAGDLREKAGVAEHGPLNQEVPF